MRLAKAIAAFAVVHALLFWLFWASGANLSERGQPLFWFAYFGLGFGLLAALIAFETHKD